MTIKYNSIIKARVFFSKSKEPEIKFITVNSGIVTKIEDRIESTDGYKFYDLSTNTLCTPFCDYHLHFTKTKTPVETYNELFRNGIFSAYDGGDNTQCGFLAKKELKSLFDIKTPAFALYKEGGYGSFIGKAVSKVEEACLIIKELSGQGVDYIKLVNSGIFLPKSGAVSRGGFSFDELKKIVNCCNNLGLNTQCHANGDKAVREAVESGVSTIIHGFFPSINTIRLMSKKGVSIIPTVNALFSLTKIAKTNEQKQTVLEAAKKHLETIKICFDEGVKLLCGSDSGPDFLPYGSAFIDELRLFKQAGIDDKDILSSAGAIPVETGMRADFAAIDKTFSPLQIFANGKLLNNSVK